MLIGGYRHPQDFDNSIKFKYSSRDRDSVSLLYDARDLITAAADAAACIKGCKLAIQRSYPSSSVAAVSQFHLFGDSYNSQSSN